MCLLSNCHCLLAVLPHGGQFDNRRVVDVYQQTQVGDERGCEGGVAAGVVQQPDRSCLNSTVDNGDGDRCGGGGIPRRIAGHRREGVRPVENSRRIP